MKQPAPAPTPTPLKSQSVKVFDVTANNSLYTMLRGCLNLENVRRNCHSSILADLDNVPKAAKAITTGFNYPEPRSLKECFPDIQNHVAGLVQAPVFDK